MRVRIPALGAGVAMVGAVSVPGWRSGIGWSIAGVAVGLAALWTAVGASPREGRAWRIAVGASPREGRAWRIAAGVAALALASVAGVRDAGWLVTLCLVGSVCTGSYAVAGGETWRGVGRGLVAVPVSIVAGVRGLARDRDDRSERRWPRPALAAGAGVVLVVVFGTLFRAADPRFDELLGGWTDELSPGAIARAVIGALLCAGLLAGAVHVLTCDPEPVPAHVAGRRSWRPADWVAPLVMLDGLFALFVWVQLTTLFAGEEYVLAEEGPDYAEYARGGFVLLAFVTVLALAVVGGLALKAGRDSLRERVLLRVLGGLLCGLTLVVVASALKRMLLYVSAYGFSAQRIVGFAAEIWLGLVLVLVLAAGFTLRANWLPRAVAASAVLVLLGLAAVNPEAVIVRTHAERIDDGYGVDYTYLYELSADAAAELAKLGDCAGAPLFTRVDEGEPWYAWNAARARARHVAASHDADCPRTP